MNIHKKFQKIRCFIFDVDGVLTDGKFLLTDDGGFFRSMSAKDGFAMKHAIDNGFTLAIITGGWSEGVTNRLAKLGVQHIYTKANDKLPCFNDFLTKEEISKEHILYMGDDVADLPVLREVGLSSCPKDAVSEVLTTCDYISKNNGGENCVREVIEITMRSQNFWNF